MTGRFTLKIFHWVDGPPDMLMDLGWNWRLEDAAGKPRAENDGRFESADEARADALNLCFDWTKVDFVVLGKWNPDEPDEYVDGKYSGKYG